MNICNTLDNLQIEMSVMSVKMADGSPPADVKIFTDSDTLQTELSAMTVTSEKWMDGEVYYEVLCLDGLASDDNPEDRSLDVDDEDGVCQDSIPTVVSIQPEVTEEWMDRFVVDLVECPSVSRTSAVAGRSGRPCLRSIPLLFLLGAVADACPLVVVESDSAQVSGLQLVGFDAVGLGVGPLCLRVDLEEALLKRIEERAPLACAAPGATPEKKLVTKFWMVGRQETRIGAENMKYVPQMTVSVWMPLNQTCIKESGDADFDSFKTAPWDAGGTQSDEFHEVMCRAMVHNIDGCTTRNTKRELATKMLMNTNCPWLTMTPGECDVSYRGTQIGSALHDTLAIPDDYTRRKDDVILGRSAVCVEIDSSADMNCTAVELNNVTLRRKLPQRQDSAEHDECYISVSAGCGEVVVFLEVDCKAVELDDVVVRQQRLLRREVFVEGVEKKFITPRTDSGSAEQNNLTFRWPKSPWRDGSTEQEMC